MNQRQSKRKRIAVFGHFDSTNLGNEGTLQAMLYNLRRFLPDAEVTCICTDPKVTAANYHVEAISISETFVKSWIPQNTITRGLRKLLVGLGCEPYRWFTGLKRLRRADMLIIPGTGLLTDAFGNLNWGPYNLLKWSLIAKFCRCKIFFVSVGAGPVYGTLGRFFVKSILLLADFRSYRDNSTKQYLEGIGFHTGDDWVYPDLAFSLPDDVIPQQGNMKSRKPVVGLGVMVDAGKYGDSRLGDATYSTYLENLATLVGWLLARQYSVRLLCGDLVDMHAWQVFKALLKERLPACDEEHVIDEPICSLGDLLSQIAATDIVVATRFHNVLLGLLCSRPVISISFHHKCRSLMSAVGLSKYCVDISNLEADKLIEKFCDLEKNADKIKPLIMEKAKEFREALDEQYKRIFDRI